ncbi:sensor histidine kinase [Actinomadura vinacea]|uniref:sensor histidine kinase n=1 Tax=Actinomadura vinacea TaxID=115336 RepID=UPI0031E43F0B
MAAVVIAVVLAGLVAAPDQPSPVPATAAMLVLQLLHSLPRTRPIRDRFGAWTLTLQAVLLPLGGPAGFLAASVLLIVPRRARWALFAAVVGAAGLLHDGDLYTHLNAMGNALCQGLLVFALTRLSDLRDELAATRGELAARSVAAERARASGALEDALGTALSEIIRLASEGRPAAIVERATAARAEIRRAPEPAPLPPPGDMTPRTALPIIVIGHLWYPVIAVLYLVPVGPPPVLLALYIADIVAVVALQVHHVLPRPPGVPPRHAAWTLPAQALLAAAPLLAPDRPYPQLMWFAAGAILIVLASRPGWAWTLFAAYAALVPATLPARGWDALDTALWTAETAGGAMMFYGLALLARLVHRVREVRMSLAFLAVAEERRRIARDVHDLLGSGMWTIMVKAELAARDPAAGALADVAAVARRTLGDLRAIPDEGTALSASAELDSARDLLTAAGIDLTVTWPPGLDLPEPAGIVLREAVTNVMRHSAARHCLIEASRDGDRLRLRVVNDGAVPAGTPGQGLANLAARTAELHTRSLPDGTFELSVVLQPAGLGGDPDRVEPVAGAQLADDHTQVVADRPP